MENKTVGNLTKDATVASVISAMRKNKKAINTLTNIGVKKAGIQLAIDAIQAEQEKLQKLAMAIVLRDITEALKD